MDSKARHDAVTRFNNDPRVNICLLSLLAGGVGLNLTAANHLIQLDMHFNPAWEQQASDRIHRIGQTRPVTIHTFVCVNTIEERIEQIQVMHQSLLPPPPAHNCEIRALILAGKEKGTCTVDNPGPQTHRRGGKAAVEVSTEKKKIKGT
jgi:hypothetical protein